LSPKEVTKSRLNNTRKEKDLLIFFFDFSQKVVAL